jgi:hypothetical protein
MSSLTPHTHLFLLCRRVQVYLWNVDTPTPLTTYSFGELVRSQLPQPNERDSARELMLEGWVRAGFLAEVGEHGGDKAGLQRHRGRQQRRRRPRLQAHLLSHVAGDTPKRTTQTHLH